MYIVNQLCTHCQKVSGKQHSKIYKIFYQNSLSLMYIAFHCVSVGFYMLSFFVVLIVDF